MNRAVSSSPARTNRCVLVSVEFSGRRRAMSRAAAAARAAAQPTSPLEQLPDGLPNAADNGHSDRAPRPGASAFDFDAAREEFRELVMSAGGDVVAEVAQR